MSNLLNQESKKLSEQASHEIAELRRKLDPFWETFKHHHRAVGYTFLDWRDLASTEAAKFGDGVMSDYGLSKSYLSKLRAIRSFKRSTLEGEPVDLQIWFDKHGIETQYLLTRTTFNDLVKLWDGDVKVTRSLAQQLNQSSIEGMKQEREKAERKEEKAKDKAEMTRLGIDSERKQFLETQIIDNDNLRLINSLDLAHYWSALSTDQLLTLIEQKLEGTSSTDVFRVRLEELLNKLQANEANGQIVDLNKQGSDGLKERIGCFANVYSY